MEISRGCSSLRILQCSTVGLRKKFPISTSDVTNGVPETKTSSLGHFTQYASRPSNWHQCSVFIMTQLSRVGKTEYQAKCGSLGALIHVIFYCRFGCSLFIHSFIHSSDAIKCVFCGQARDFNFIDCRAYKYIHSFQTSCQASSSSIAWVLCIDECKA